MVWYNSGVKSDHFIAQIPENLLDKYFTYMIDRLSNRLHFYSPYPYKEIVNVDKGRFMYKDHKNNTLRIGLCNVLVDASVMVLPFLSLLVAGIVLDNPAIGVLAGFFLQRWGLLR